MFAGFVDHGVWAAYKPDTVPAGAPGSAMFAQRHDDGQDWYEHVHPGTNFQATSVKFTVAIVQPTDTTFGYTVIKAPAVDATMLFPSDNMRVIEMLGDYSSYTSEQLINEFASKMINLDTGDITDPPSLPSKVKEVMDGINKRLNALEHKS